MFEKETVLLADIYYGQLDKPLIWDASVCVSIDSNETDAPGIISVSATAPTPDIRIRSIDTPEQVTS